MLIRGGENIYCVEVENVLYDHPAVMDAALVGIAAQDAGRGARRRRPPEARRPGHARTSCAPSSASASPPSRCRCKIAFWPETLPRNANGKILKGELKKLFATLLG